MQGQYWWWVLHKMPGMTAKELPTPHVPLGHADLGVRAETGKEATQESEDMESVPASGGCPSLAPSVNSGGRLGLGGAQGRLGWGGGPGEARMG